MDEVSQGPSFCTETIVDRGNRLESDTHIPFDGWVYLSGVIRGVLPLAVDEVSHRRDSVSD